MTSLFVFAFALCNTQTLESSKDRFGQSKKQKKLDGLRSGQAFMGFPAYLLWYYPRLEVVGLQDAMHARRDK